MRKAPTAYPAAASERFRSGPSVLTTAAARNRAAMTKTSGFDMVSALRAWKPRNALDLVNLSRMVQRFEIAAGPHTRPALLPYLTGAPQDQGSGRCRRSAAWQAAEGFAGMALGFVQT